MKAGKYSNIRLKLKSRLEFSLNGSRKGLSPFVLEIKLIDVENNILQEKFLDLTLPYIQSKTFSEHNETIQPIYHEFLDKIDLKQPIIKFSLSLKPVEYLAHESPLEINFETTTNKGQADKLQIKGYFTKNKKKKISFSAPKEKNTLNVTFTKILELIKEKIEDLDPEILSWLLI